MLWQLFASVRPLTHFRLIPPYRTCKSRPVGQHEPIVYSKSKASKWKASQTLRVPDSVQNMPNAQPYSIVVSLSIFMIYFFILREENDIDELFERPLQQTVTDIKKTDWGQIGRK
ncbi:uncharacterized protein LOC111268766 [Varroa jacobsoni]|uniref:uncharacterized protein LOC111268766 n=1 Tax=Varroa jacobsoni TaxID=62625 RepID=UPI000BF78F65|nr:uncharacterized protein LOC111268766 [Varroa jacobsoni]